MSARTADGYAPEEPFQVIHLGGQAAAIVPLTELRRLRAIERHASPEAIDEAEADAIMAEYADWAAAGRPGALTHEQAIRELISGS